MIGAILRRTIQCIVVFILLMIPVVSRYANYVAAREIDDNLERWDGTLQGEVLAVVDKTFRQLPGAEKERVGEMVRHREQVLTYTQSLRGGPWSAEIAGVSMTDPLGAAESILGRKHIAKVLLISLIIPVALTIFFGRVFCSWICPVGFLLEMTDTLRTLLKFLEVPTKNIKFPPLTKYVLLGVGLVMTFILSVPVLSYIYPPAIMNREIHELVFGIFDRAEEGRYGLWFGGLTWMSFFIGAIILFELLVSRRWWCRYVCPGGALYSLLGAARPIRVKLVEQKCTRCADCIVACPMGLNPMNNAMGMECDNCGLCISSCHDDALTYGIRRTPSIPAAASQQSLPTP